MKAWVGQRAKDIRAKGESEASWIVFWNDPRSGKRREKSCGPGSSGRELAQREAERIHHQIVSGAEAPLHKTSWAEFRARYEAEVLSSKSLGTRTEFATLAKHFERIIEPGSVADITSETIDRYKAARSAENGRREGDTASPATINKELRHLKAALRKAHFWNCLAQAPEIAFLPEAPKESSYVTPDHFAAIYAACDEAGKPRQYAFSASDWWRALLVTSYLTGWRISETLALRWEQVDLEQGAVTTQSKAAGASPEELVRLHPIALEHCRRLAGAEPLVFPWPESRRSLYSEFYRLQQEAGIHLPCDRPHQHTDTCHLYGFHDKRRAFAALNANRLSADALQRIMRHQSPATTQRYLQMARQRDDEVEAIHVPLILSKWQSL